MNCLQCQAQNPGDAVFCENCGSRLEVVCPNCGGATRLGAKFCKKCGQRLLEAAPAALVTAGKFGSVEAYTPRHLAEKILISKNALEGERKQVTVLFADLKGSMELLADRDPEEARKLLDPVLEHMMEAVHRYEGTVNQVMGDGIMALFGAPLAHEDHAVRACYSALRMQESTKRYAEGVRRTEGMPIQIRVGLNSGEVVVRSIGSDLKMDYTAVGQTTHLAARMEQLATPGSILVTAETLRLAAGYVEVKPLGPVNVKGLSDLVEVYEVTGAGAARTRFQAAASHGLTRFVGRDAETEQLQKTLEQARASAGQLVAVVGEPGVGKSRLFHEFTHSHRTEGCLIVESGSVSYGKATPYLPVIDLLKAYFKIQGRDHQREIREKVTGKLLTLDKTLEPVLSAFLSLLDVAVEDQRWQNLDPPQQRQHTLDAIKRLLLRESQIQPLVLVFEDLHWIDSETQAVLDSLVDSLSTSSLLLLVNYRPEYRHGWGSKTYYSQLPIDPLSAESVEELLGALLGNDPTLKPLKQLLIERTEGNPFFLEESVRTLVETKVLLGERGKYRLTGPIEITRVPATVHAMLAARVDRLSLDEKSLLQSAAVIGKDVPFVLLHAIAELSEEELRRELGHLQAAEFLYETRLFPDLEYTFKHALTHEVTYGSLLQERRRALHARIVDAIETLYPDHLAERVDTLAHHAYRAQLWEKAVTYLHQAGGKAAARSANREALTCFEHALIALKNLPESQEILERAIDLRFDIRNALMPLAENERISGYLREAEVLAHTLNDQRRLGWVSAYIAENIRGDHDRAIESARRALAIAQDLKDFGLRVVANYFLALAHDAQGDYRRAIEFLRWNVSSIEGEPIFERVAQADLPFVPSRARLALCFADLGEFQEGTTYAEEGVRMAEAVDHPYALTLAYYGVGYLHLRKGDLDKAITTLERSLRLCQSWDIRSWFPTVASALGYALAVVGRVAEVLPLLEQAMEQAISRRIPTSRSSLTAEGYLLAGEIDRATRLTERSLDFSRHRKQRGNEAWTLRLLGDIAAYHDHPDVATAEAHCGAAMTQASEIGMRPLIAHCHLGLGRMYRRIGKQQQEANEHLTTATTMMREMEMGLWLEKAEAELKELR